MKLKKLAAMSGILALLAASLIGCGKGSDNGGGKNSGDVSITIFNSKSEIQEYLEDAAETYGKENHVNIEVYFSYDTVAAHLAAKYAANDPYTMAMTDAKDIYTLGAQFGYDMSNQAWVEDTDFEISVDGKALGFPVCIEARGLLYYMGLSATSGRGLFFYDCLSHQEIGMQREMFSPKVASHGCRIYRCSIRRGE